MYELFSNMLLLEYQQTLSHLLFCYGAIMFQYLCWCHFQCLLQP